MIELFNKLRGLLDGKKQHGMGLSLILFGVLLLAGVVEPERVELKVDGVPIAEGPITLENMDQALQTVAAQAAAKAAAEMQGVAVEEGAPPAIPGGSTGLLGVLALLLGGNSLADRAAKTKLEQRMNAVLMRRARRGVVTNSTGKPLAAASDTAEGGTDVGPQG